MSTLTATIGAAQRWAFRLAAEDVQYRPQAAPAPSVIKGFSRGLRSDDAFGSFFEGELFFQVDADQFAIVVGNTTPRRFDRVILSGARQFTVQEWRGAPEDVPVFFKMRLRGDSQ